MRPRLLHLGYAGRLDDADFYAAASMRPRLLHLGYDCTPWTVSGADCCFNEAEAFTPRIPDRDSPAARPGSASMRPRLLHLGYPVCAHAVGGRRGASMRPRLLHLGYLTGQELPRARMTRFNEAEAFTPRIPPGSPPGGASVDGFNEAEAFTPRIPGQGEQK